MHRDRKPNRRRKGNVGVTASKTCAGGDCNAQVTEFGECVWYLGSGPASKERLSVRWKDGAWLAVRDETGVSIPGTPEGILK